MKPMSKPTILVVDDTPANIKILADLLRHDYRLSVATSGADALEIASGPGRPDLVLLDIMMPEMDGYEVCRRLKADPNTVDVPIIFVTAMSEVDDEAKGFALGAVDYITKPILPPIVKARVAAHLELALARKTLAAQNAAMRSALAVAADVQRSLLPKTPPSLPGLELAGRMIPCESVGGDYLDFLVGDEFAGRGVGLVVGDVTGHGPGAALLMTAARAFLRMRASRPGGLDAIVSDMNRHLAADLGDIERFMTFYLLAIDGDSLSWVSAGHDPALLVDPASGTIAELEGNGLLLGVDPDVSYAEHRASFGGPGRVLALYTDGITETWSPAGEMFGRDRLSQGLLRLGHLSAREIADGLIREVQEFRGDGPQHQANPVRKSA
jgi:sigma-B regulation protein RsbU (phosphoserine phosphatase)